MIVNRVSTLPHITISASASPSSFPCLGRRLEWLPVPQTRIYPLLPSRTTLLARTTSRGTPPIAVSLFPCSLFVLGTSPQLVLHRPSACRASRRALRPTVPALSLWLFAHNTNSWVPCARHSAESAAESTERSVFPYFVVLYASTYVSVAVLRSCFASPQFFPCTYSRLHQSRGPQIFPGSLRDTLPSTLQGRSHCLHLHSGNKRLSLLLPWHLMLWMPLLPSSLHDYTRLFQTRLRDSSLGHRHLLRQCHFPFLSHSALTRRLLAFPRCPNHLITCCHGQ